MSTDPRETYRHGNAAVPTPIRFVEGAWLRDAKKRFHGFHGFHANSTLIVISTGLDAQLTVVESPPAFFVEIPKAQGIGKDAAPLY